MEGHFLVCENVKEEFDINFQVNSTMDSVIPKDQQELYVKAESACNIIKALENTDKQTKKKYFDKHFPCLRLDLWQIRHRQKQQNLH